MTDTPEQSEQAAAPHEKKAGKGAKGKQKPSLSVRRGLPISLLGLATLIVVAAYGSLFTWLSLNEADHHSTEPSVVVALTPEPAPPAESLLRTAPAEDIIPDPPQTLPAPQNPSAEAPSPDATNGPAVPPKEQAGPAPPKPEAPRPQSGDIRLTPVPDPTLVSISKYGPLPVISPDGKRAWQIYARPLSAAAKGDQTRPRVAIVLGGMGISATATRNAIDKLPPEVTLSFAPYAKNLQSWIDKARKAGHEVLLELPMEPYNYPENDPGPYTLLTSSTPAENIDRLEWLMGRFTGYVGTMNYQGAKFTATEEALRPVLEALSSRGLMHVDTGSWPRAVTPKVAGEFNLPLARGTKRIDQSQNPALIEKALTALEKKADQTGVAVGIGAGFPVTVDKVTAWAKGLSDRGVILVPVTATARTGQN